MIGQLLSATGWMLGISAYSLFGNLWAFPRIFRHSRRRRVIWPRFVLVAALMWGIFFLPPSQPLGAIAGGVGGIMGSMWCFVEDDDDHRKRRRERRAALKRALSMIGIHANPAPEGS